MNRWELATAFAALAVMTGVTSLACTALKDGHGPFSQAMNDTLNGKPPVKGQAKESTLPFNTTSLVVRPASSPSNLETSEPGAPAQGVSGPSALPRNP